MDRTALSDDEYRFYCWIYHRRRLFCSGGGFPDFTGRGIIWLDGGHYGGFSASLGDLLVFLAARGACASFFQASGSRFINRLKNGFDKSPFFWLLALRLMPVAPFWVVNIIPAMLGMRVFPYLMATVIGIIPGSAIFVYTGIGFGELMTRGQTPDLAILSDQHFIGPILALSLLAVIPAIVNLAAVAIAENDIEER